MDFGKRMKEDLGAELFFFLTVIVISEAKSMHV